MPIVSTHALIIQAFGYSDTSKILRIYTPDYGLRSVIAKGARRPKSRFGGLLEPFTEGEASFYLKPGRDLHTLGGFDLLHSRQVLGRDLLAFTGASTVVELLLRFGTEEPNPALFAVAVTSLDRIAASRSADATEVTVLSAAWSMIALLGFRPETEVCISCGRSLAADEPARFDAEGGGAACADCRPRGRVLDVQSRAELGWMLGGGEMPTAFARPPVQRVLLRTFLAAHLSQEHPLRSLELFFQEMG